MKKSLVKILASSTIALSFVGAHSVFAAPANVDVNAPVFSTKADADYWVSQNQTVGNTLSVVLDADGKWYVVDTAKTDAPTNPQQIGSPDEEGTPANPGNNYDLNEYEDPYSTEDEVVKDEQQNAFENVGRHFPTLKEAVEAYPESHVMYDPATSDYVAFTNVQGQKVYTFASVQDAVNAFPNLSPIFEDGVYRVYTDQAPRLQYEFATEQEAYDMFGFDANPMYNPTTGKYLVYTNKLPKLVHVFDTFKDAMDAFPGSYPMFKDGKYYVFTTFEKIAGTNGTVEKEPKASLQDDEFASETATDSKKPEAGDNESKATTEATKEVKGNKPAKEVKEVKEAKEEESKKAALPETGETSSFAIYGAAVLSVLAGLGFVASKREDA